jgi:hypothetical protein
MNYHFLCQKRINSCFIGICVLNLGHSFDYLENK